jgi:hypothetical protein
MPFNVVEKTGFRKFLLQNKVVKDVSETPAAYTLARSALQTIYDETRTKVVK